MMCPLLFPSRMAMGQESQLTVNRQLPFQQRLQSLVWKPFLALQNPTLFLCYNKWKEQWEEKWFWSQARQNKNGLSDTYTTSTLGELLKCSESQFLNL